MREKRTRRAGKRVESQNEHRAEEPVPFPARSNSMLQSYFSFLHRARLPFFVRQSLRSQRVGR